MTVIEIIGMIVGIVGGIISIYEFFIKKLMKKITIKAYDIRFQEVQGFIVYISMKLIVNNKTDCKTEIDDLSLQFDSKIYTPFYEELSVFPPDSSEGIYFKLPNKIIANANENIVFETQTAMDFYSENRKKYLTTNKIKLSYKISNKVKTIVIRKFKPTMGKEITNNNNWKLL